MFGCLTERNNKEALAQVWFASKGAQLVLRCRGYMKEGNERIILRVYRPKA